MVAWEGRNDNDPGSGRGWAKIVGDQLVGRIYIHLGDDSAFAAKRQERPKVASPGRRARVPRLMKLQTHRVHGITQSDLALARKIEEVAVWKPGSDSPLSGFPKNWVR